MGHVIYTISPTQKYMAIEILLCGPGSLVSEGHLLFPKDPKLQEHLALYTLHKTPMDGASPSGSPNMITPYEHCEHHLTPI